MAAAIPLHLAAQHFHYYHRPLLRPGRILRPLRIFQPIFSLKMAFVTGVDNSISFQSLYTTVILRLEIDQFLNTLLVAGQTPAEHLPS